MTVLKIRGDNIISVDIPSIVISNRDGECSKRYIPFTALKVTNGVREDETMARADRFDNAADYVILSPTGVCLVHGVELTTTTLDLESIRLE